MFCRLLPIQVAMLERILHTMAVVASTIVFVSWGMFAIDETRAASQQSQAEILGRKATHIVDPTPDQERAREKLHSSVREYVDDANDMLLSPFASIGSASASGWVRRSVPMLIALLVYGFGLGYLARLISAREHTLRTP